jgi:choline kinase
VIGVSKNLNGIPSRNIILSEYIGVLKLSQKSIRILSNLSSVDNDKDYEEVINDEIANLDFEVLNLQSLSWHEIDTEKDYYSILENWKY